MSNKPLQSLDNIGPIKDGKQAAADDPILADFNKGKEHLAREEFSQAAAAFHNALLGYEEKGDDPGIANASNQLGNVCLAGKEYEQALKHFDRAWEICEKLGDRMSLIVLSNGYIQVYRGMENWEKAISLCLDVLDTYFANNDPKGAVEILEQMAEIYLDEGNKEKAADAYRTIASIHKNFKHKNIAESFLEKAKNLETGG